MLFLFITEVGAGLVPAQIEKTHLGGVVENVYLEMNDIYKNIKSHNYKIATNHIQGIIEIGDMLIRAGTRPAPTNLHLFIVTIGL